MTSIYGANKHLTSNPFCRMIRSLNKYCMFDHLDWSIPDDELIGGLFWEFILPRFAPCEILFLGIITYIAFMGETVTSCHV